MKQTKKESEKWNEVYIKRKVRDEEKTCKRMRKGMKEIVREEESELRE
jgi:hypothetical protein